MNLFVSRFGSWKKPLNKICALAFSRCGQYLVTGEGGTNPTIKVNSFLF